MWAWKGLSYIIEINTDRAECWAKRVAYIDVNIQTHVKLWVWAYETWMSADQAENYTNRNSKAWWMQPQAPRVCLREDTTSNIAKYDEQMYKNMKN